MHLLDTTMFYADRSGGVRAYLDAKRAWLNGRAGDRHTLLLPAGAARPKDGHAQDGIEWLARPALPLAGGYRLPLARAEAARAMRRLGPQLIEAGDPFRLAWAALDAGQALGAPTVAFCHSDLPRVLHRLFGSRGARIGCAYLRRLYPQFDLVLAPSEALAGRLAELGVQRLARQPLGVDTTTFHPLTADAPLRRRWRERLELPAGTRLLVFAGRFAPEKNLALLVEALTFLGPHYRLLLVGHGRLPPAHPRSLVLPFLRGRCALASLLASCDVFVHAGDQETFGLAALEALACGLPVVAARAGGLAELVDEEVGGCFPAGNARALAAAIRALESADPVLLAGAARGRALRHAWQTILPQLRARYAALADAQRAAA